MLQSYLQGGSSLFSCFLDMSKAYERIEHSLLLDQLRLISLPPYVVIIIIECNLRNNWNSVKFNEAKSSPWKARRGVCQGRIASAGSSTSTLTIS